MKFPSTGVTSVRVTLPVLVTRNEKVTFCPAVVNEAKLADFTTDNAGFGSLGTVTFDDGDTGGAAARRGAGGGRGVADLPGVHIRLRHRVRRGAGHRAPGANDAAPAGHTGADTVPDPVNTPSTGCTSVRVTLPVLVTTNR